ncbi:MAG: efflux RND transporter periplasmic adaptor subunit [Chloroflexota bacterium]
MKKRGIMGMLLLGLLILTIACSGGGEKITRPAVKSDITVTGNGNIEALSHAKLTFGSGGKVADIAVKEGDNVSKDDVLARLDTSALELALNQAKVAQAEAQVAVNSAEIAVTQAQVGVTQAEVALQTAEYHLEFAQDLYTWSDIRIAQADVDEAKDYLEYSLEKLGQYIPRDGESQYPDTLEYVLGEGSKLPGYEVWQERLVHAQARLNAAKDRLNAMLSGYDTKEVAIKKLQVEVAQQSVELAEQTLGIAEQSLSLAKQSFEFTCQSVELVQKQLDEATITAPFDGIVARVGAKEGEFLSPAAYAGTTIVELIDLRYMELTARIDELDIVRVKTEQKVIISVDALPGTVLEGRVTFISPVAREPGAVLFEDEDEEKEYEVKIDFNIPEYLPIKAGMSATAEIFVE